MQNLVLLSDLRSSLRSCTPAKYAKDRAKRERRDAGDLNKVICGQIVYPFPFDQISAFDCSLKRGPVHLSTSLYHYAACFYTERNLAFMVDAGKDNVRQKDGTQDEYGQRFKYK